MSLSSILVLGRAELTSGSCLLLELLLLLSVGKADLNRVLFAANVDLVVVELLDDFLADRSGLETGKNVRWNSGLGWQNNSPSKADSATSTILVAKDSGRADLVRSEHRCKLVLVQRLGQIGNVEVGVTLISERLELRVERFLDRWSAHGSRLMTSGAR